MIIQLSILLLFFSIVPNLGFFSLPSFFLLSGFIITYVLSIAKYYRIKLKQPDNTIFLCFILLFYGSIYYGGLYQNDLSIIIGQLVLIVWFLLLFIAYNNNINNNNWLTCSFIIFLILSYWTISNSPKPMIDAYYILSEAPLKFLSGINPYHTVYTKVYQNINPVYYNYLPFSFIYFIPFVLLFKDPRYGILFASVISGMIIYRLYKNKISKPDLTVLITGFLFLPRAFYMLEHTYLDIVVFLFFLLFTYFSIKNKKLAYFCLGLFFSFKQNILIALPFFIKNFFQEKNKKNLAVVFTMPFILIIYFLLLNPNAFLSNIVLNLSPDKITSPIKISLTSTTFFVTLFPQYESMIYKLVPVALLVAYIFIFKSKFSRLQKLTLSIFIFYFFSYHGFFNSYYLVSLFVFLEIINQFSKSSKIIRKKI